MNTDVFRYETAPVFRNPALAATYERIVEEAESAGGDREAQIEAARRAWYRGFVAEAIDRFCRTTEVLDVTGRRHRGLLTGDDLGPLKGWNVERDPLPLESSVPGIFAAGDVRHGSIKRVAGAVGEGSTAIRFVHTHLAAL